LLIAMDLYPEVLVAHGMVARRGMFARLMRAIFAWAYRSASTVVALGPVMAERIRAKGVGGGRVVEICNWATGAPGTVQGRVNRLRAELGLGDSFVLVYSGNLGLSHEFEALLRGFAIAVRHVPSLRLLFFGSGTRLDEIRQLAGELDLGPSVTFLPFVPSDRLPETLGLADLGVVTLRDGFEGLVVPSKLMGYMSRGIPVLYIGPRSDADLLVSRLNCGFSIRNGDSKTVAHTIVEAHGDRGRLREMGRAGRDAYENGLTREHGLSRYEAVVRACLDAGRGAG
jgi:glycosyltransferase involved in cell wall biosynthesis